MRAFARQLQHGRLSVAVQDHNTCVGLVLSSRDLFTFGSSKAPNPGVSTRQRQTESPDEPFSDCDVPKGHEPHAESCLVLPALLTELMIRIAGFVRPQNGQDPQKQARTRTQGGISSSPLASSLYVR